MKAVEKDCKLEKSEFYFTTIARCDGLFYYLLKRSWAPLILAQKNKSRKQKSFELLVYRLDSRGFNII